MRPIEKYIEEVMESKGFTSYSAMSQKLDMNHNAVFSVMKKGVTPSDEMCKKLAALAGDPPEKALLLAAESRAPESTRSAWSRILKATATAGLFTLGLAVLLWANSPAPGVASITHAVASTGYYVK